MSGTIPLGAVVLDCVDPHALATFYGGVLGWRLERDGDDADPANDWATLVNPDGGVNLSFQRDPEFLAPTWPSRERHQMSHLDLTVPDLDAHHERVLALGARLLDDAPATFRVYADPEGHPFCLCAC